MIKAISYVRVSTNEQADEGVSLAAQTASIRAYAAFKGMELVHELSDAGVSASKPLQEREGGRRLFDYASQPRIKAVVSYKLDRLFRDAADCLAVTKEWDELGVDLHLVDLGGQPVDTSTAMGRFFLTIMAGVAEMERNLIAERTKAALSHLKSQGKRTGGIPYGYKLAADGRTLVKEPEEQRVIANARALRREGLSLRKVSAALRDKGMRSRNGRPFQATQIMRLLE
jgi:DNA invertase Pin-like site-specific DNA recombinase